ncbi:MAG: 2-oxo acid dehydrogenase subunit E2 [Terriglobia bacterium]
MATEFRLPELGENIAAGDVLKVLVSPGDSISKDQPVVELETDKATIEVPAPSSGTVTAVHVKEGQKLQVGGLIITIEEGSAAKAEKRETPAPAAGTAKPPTTPSPAKAPVAPKATERPVKAAPAPPPAAKPLPARPAAEPKAPRVAAPATPSVRRLARELGVEIAAVTGTGPGGRIKEEDVKAYVKALMTRGGAAAPGAPTPAVPLPDFSRWGEIDRQPMRSVRRKTAEHLSHAWSTIPHVTNHDKADITELEQLRKKQEARVAAAGGKLTLSAIAVKVVAAGIKTFPQFAASVDLGREEIVYKKYVHIGVAVDTDRGLLVPVIRDADKKNILELSVELAQIAERARNRKTALEEMEGGVFTISNLGGIGGTHFSPIVNWPEVAILGISRGRTEPVFVNGLFQPRLMLPLSLSYDHRIIDGADAARFLRWIVEAFEQPFLLALDG